MADMAPKKTAAHGGARSGAGRKPGRVSEAKRNLMEMAKEHAEAALTTLVEIATAGDSEAARVSAANAILDRGYGRPVQGLEVSGPEGGPVQITRIELVPMDFGAAHPKFKNDRP